MNDFLIGKITVYTDQDVDDPDFEHAQDELAWKLEAALAEVVRTFQAEHPQLSFHATVDSPYDDLV